MSNLFEKKPCDIFLILGDRYETLASAYVANFFGIPIAHISGGDITIGSQDDSYRHAITKLSRFHFVSHKSYKKRLLQLGEEKKNIFETLTAQGPQSTKWCQEKWRGHPPPISSTHRWPG